LPDAACAKSIFIEPVPPALAALPGIHIRNLRKEFLNDQGEAFAAVDDLDVSMYQGQVRAYSPCVFLWPVPF
jgi:hypothetical protein